VAVPIVVGVALAIAGTNAFAASRSARVSQLERLGGHAQASVEAARNATSLDERRPEYWDTLGLAYVRADRLGDAIRAFERATSLAPYNSAFLGDLASANLLLLQAGDAPAGARARDAANRAVLADPNSPQANLSRAIAMRATGDLSEALRSVERALRLDPSSSKLPLYLAATQIYRANGRTQDAIVTARRGISSLSPRETIPVRVELARALLEAGQTDQAVMELDAALAISPNDQTAQQLRAQIRTSAPSQ
jgi:cytochrome c-type biogenesis protein CcmH/NrfG